MHSKNLILCKCFFFFVLANFVDKLKKISAMTSKKLLNLCVSILIQSQTINQQQSILFV